MIFRHVRTLVVGITYVCLFLLLFSDVFGLYHTGYRMSQDQLAKLFPPKINTALSQRMVFVDIDDASLNSLGQWPFPRQLLAQLVDALSDSAPAVIGLDIILSEPDRFGPALVARRAGLAEDSFKHILADGDAILAERLSEQKTVLASVLTNTSSVNPSFATQNLIIETDGTKLPAFLGANELISPLPMFQDNTVSASVNVALPSIYSGVAPPVVRDVPLVLTHNHNFIVSLPVEMMRHAISADTSITVRLQSWPQRLTMHIGTHRLILPAHALLPLSYIPHDMFTHISAQSVLTAAPYRLPPNSYVIIGSSAAGLGDRHHTAFNHDVPGPIVHLTALYQMLTGKIILPLPYHRAIEFILCLSICLALAKWGERPSFKFVTFWCITSIALLVLFSLWLYSVHSVLINFIYCSFILSSHHLLFSGYKGSREAWRRHIIMNRFSVFLAPEIVKTLASTPHNPNTGGHIKHITVMIADIRDFSLLSRQYADAPQQLARIVNEVFSEITEEVLNTQGMVDKFVGDSVLAFWNIPSDINNHSDKAISCACAISAKLAALNRRLLQQNLISEGVELKIGIGIASGQVLAGHFGSSRKLNYSAIGNCVNLATRLQELSKTTGHIIHIDTNTAADTLHTALTDIGSFDIKGWPAPVPVFVPAYPHAS